MLELGIIEEIRTAWRSVGFYRTQLAMVQAVPVAADLKALQLLMNISDRDVAAGY